MLEIIEAPAWISGAEMMMPIEGDGAAESFLIPLAGSTGMACGAVLHRGGLLDPGLIPPFAESLH